MDSMNEFVRCKHCKNLEYYGEYRWLNGRQLCRNCYKAEYQTYHGKVYEWNDLEGERPKEQERMIKS